MPLEPVSIVAAALPFLKDFAVGRAKKLAEKEADGKLASLYQRLLPDEKLRKVNEAFASRFGKELDSAMDLPTLQADSYARALEEFLRNPSVQDLLVAPLDGYTALDGSLLRSIWAETLLDGRTLIALPEDFEWDKVAKLYAKSALRQGLGDSKLRPVITALSQLRTEEQARKTTAALERMAPLARAFDLGRYAADLKQAFGYLKLGSIDTEWVQYENRVRLENVYVPQSAKQALPPQDLTRDYRKLLEKEKRAHGLEGDMDEEEAKSRRREYAELTPQPIFDVVDDAKNQRLVILGDPGLGKSTLMKRLALRWAEDPGRPLTLFLELRRAAESDFVDYLEKGAGPGCGLPRNELDGHLQKEGSLVLFDGLDEVDAAKRDDVVGRLVRFAGDYPLARVVVTTRIVGYSLGSTHPETFRDAGFEQFTLQDFGDNEIESFIGGWHREAFGDAVERERYESRLRTAVDDSPAIRELAANPLLLTMMAILSRVQDLPRDRADLYGRCAELLLQNWDLEKFHEHKDKLGPKQKMRILERVAEAMQQERTGLAGNLISQDKLEGIVAEELRDVGILEPRAAEELIRMLRERNFMLGYLGDRQYAFVHRTFVEYSCARDLKYRLEKIPEGKPERLSVSDLAAYYSGHWNDDAWREPLRLLSGMIGVDFVVKSIEAVLEQVTDRTFGALFFAAECLREVGSSSRLQAVRQAVHTQLTRLMETEQTAWAGNMSGLPGPIRVDGVGVRAVRELARGWSDDTSTPKHLSQHALGSSYQLVKIAVVQELARGWKGHPEVRDALLRFASDDNETVQLAVVQELAQGWNDDPTVDGWLLERAACHESEFARKQTIEQLANARKWKGRFRDLLCQRAVSDGSEIVRRTAVAELAQRYPDDKEIRDLLLKQAVGDQSELVRSAALEGLAKSWQNDKDVRDLLVERVTGDCSEEVRATALEGLASYWRDYRGVRDLLLSRASEEHGESVRRTALWGLAHGWKGDPSVRKLLLDRAYSDPGESVRRVAVRELIYGWYGDEDVRDLLLDRLAKDGAYVRQRAVWGLAQGWESDKYVRNRLCERIAVDEDEEVRRIGVAELSQSWPGDANVRDLLMERTAADESWRVRWTAATALGKRWTDDRKVRDFLLERATCDDIAVRAVALEELPKGWKNDPKVRAFLAKREESG